MKTMYGWNGITPNQNSFQQDQRILKEKGGIEQELSGKTKLKTKMKIYDECFLSFCFIYEAKRIKHDTSIKKEISWQKKDEKL